MVFVFVNGDVKKGVSVKERVSFWPNQWITRYLLKVQSKFKNCSKTMLICKICKIQDLLEVLCSIKQFFKIFLPINQDQDYQDKKNTFPFKQDHLYYGYDFHLWDGYLGLWLWD